MRKRRNKCKLNVCHYGQYQIIRQDKKVSTNESKAKGLGQAFFLKGLRVSRGQSHLVALRRGRNPFADGMNDYTVSRLAKNPKSRLHFEFKVLQMNIFYRNKLKTIQCRRLETKRCSVRNVEFGFRRKAQVRTNSLFIFIKSVPNAKETPPGGKY